VGWLGTTRTGLFISLYIDQWYNTWLDTNTQLTYYTRILSRYASQRSGFMTLYRWAV
jgi:hypothetical protein